MTSNLGAQHIERMEKLGFARNTDNQDKVNYDEAKNKINTALKDFFRPEFLNRIDDTIIFDILSPEAIKEIVKIQMEQVVKRLKEKNIDLVLAPTVYEFMAKEGYNPQYGARPLKRLIQTKILTPLANLLIGQEVTKGGTVLVDMKNGTFTFEVKKRQRGESSIVMPKMAIQK
jgi:ATP-dependent Clp protease ATP-binding subunit ClpC